MTAPDLATLPIPTEAYPYLIGALLARIDFTGRATRKDVLRALAGYADFEERWQQRREERQPA